MLTCVIEVENFTSIVLVRSLQANTLPCGKKGNGPEPSPIGLDGKGVEISQQAPLRCQLLQSNVNAFSPGIRLASVRQYGTSGNSRTALPSLLYLEGATFVFSYAVEMVGMTMAFYMFISLSISGVLNIYNKRVQLVER